jgi:hypothetical protein
LLGLSLTACHHHKNDGGGVAVVPPVQPAAFEAQFGQGFAAAYQQSPNSEPRAVATGDVIPVSATADPVAIPK